ncbi:hypothetical protein EDB19DRAFT_1760193, partial [Suillus lakei]
VHFSTTCDLRLGFLFCSIHIYTCCDVVLISLGRCLPLAAKHGSCIVSLISVGVCLSTLHLLFML